MTAKAETVMTAAGSSPEHFAEARRHLVTVFDFLTLLPRRFAERWEIDNRRYTPPLKFLVRNLLVTMVITTAVIRRFVTDGHPGAIAVPATLGTTLNIIAVGYGAFAAWVLLQPLRLRRLAAAFCYATAWLPLYVPASVSAFIAIDLFSTNVAALAWVGLGLSQGLYLVYLVGSMARLSGYSGPVMRSFVILTMSLTVATGTLAGLRISSLEDEARSHSEPFVWNSFSDDNPLLSVSNATKHANCRTCWSSSASVAPGEIVSLCVYYHQPTAVVAHDVRVRLQIPTLIQQKGVVGADVSSREAGHPASGSAVLQVRSSAPVVLKYVDGAWFPDESLRLAKLNHPENLEAVLSDGGFRVGDVAPGCSNRGYIVSRFLVSDANGKPPLRNPDDVRLRDNCVGHRRQIQLIWSPAPAATQYMVSRDGALLATVRAAATWTDREAPSGTPSYTVVACDDSRCVDGTPTSVHPSSSGCPRTSALGTR